MASCSPVESGIYTERSLATEALSLGARLATGKVFMNRCDYRVPALAWVGSKHSDRGCTLFRIGDEQLTQTKSLHPRTVV